MTSAAGRDGVTLVTALVISLALSVLAHGALTVARLEYRAASAGVAHLEADAAAREGLKAAIESAPVPARLANDLWSPTATVSDSLGRAAYGGELIRIADETWLARGSAKVGRVSATVVGALWALDPAVRMVEAAALVSSAGVSADSSATLITSTFFDPEHAGPSGCAWGSKAEQTRSAPLPAWTRAAEEPRLGPLSLDSLARRIDDPQVMAKGDLSRSGSSSTGLLAALGDIELIASHHSGYVLALGDVVLRSGSSITGLVDAAGIVSLFDSSSVRASACWAAEALDHPQALRPVTLAAWIEPF